MVKVLIGASGSGKTYKLKNEIFHKYHSACVNSRKIYVIEREEYKEYSGLFNPNFVHALTPTSDISFLEEEKKCDIYIDCECYSEEFLKNIVKIMRSARFNDNRVTVTFQDILRNNKKEEIYQHLIFANADRIFIGYCLKHEELVIEDLFVTKLIPLKSKYDFREIINNKTL